MADSERSPIDDWFGNIDDDILDAVCRLRIKLSDDKIFERDFRPDLHIDQNNLAKQLAEVPAAYTFWSAILAEQKIQVLQLERATKRRRAIVVDELVEQSKIMQTQGIGLGSRAGIRREDIKDLLEKDDRLLEIDAKYLMALRIESKLFGIVMGLKMKSDNLRTLAAGQRSEMEMT